MSDKSRKLSSGSSATIEEALERTYFGRFNYFIIIFSGLVINNVVLESVGISFSLPVLKCDLNLTYYQQGVLGAVGFIGIIVSSHLWGFLADTIGRKRIMRPALIAEFTITLLSSFSPNFATLAVMRFLNGVLLSAGSASIFAYLGEFHSQTYRNRAILSAAFISAFMAIFFPIIAWLFINQSWEFYVPILGFYYRPWRVYMVACGTLAFTSFILLCFLPESPKYLLSIGKPDKALAVLKRIHKINTARNDKLRDTVFEITSLLPDYDTPTQTNASVSSSSSKNSVVVLIQSLWNQTAPLFNREHIRKTALSSLIQFIVFFTAHGVYMWFPYILNNTMQYTEHYGDTPLRICDILRFTQSANFSGVDDDTANISECVTRLEISTYKHTIMLEFIYIALLLTVSYMIGRFGRVPLLFSVLFLCGTAGILGLIIKLPLVAIYGIVVYLCCGIGTTVVNAIVVDIYPTHLRAMAVCISLMVGRLGSVAGSNILGLFIDRNCEASLYSAALSLVLAGFLAFLLPKPHAEKNQKNLNRI